MSNDNLNKNNALISIIVPIYNVEKYLPRCIESIINQSYRNLEIILVDDGSPDKSSEICDSYAKMDARIKVIHKVNSGVSSARNAGIDVATGEYLAFIDGDDNLSARFSEFIEQFNKDNDIVCAPYYLNKELHDNIIIPNKKWLNKNVNCVCKINKHIMILNAVWNKLFSARLVKDNNIYFDSNYKICEDLKFCLDCIYKANKIEFCGTPYYIYYRNEGSVMSNISFNKICNTLDVCKYGINYINNESDKSKKMLYKKIISENLLSVFYRINNYSEKENEYLFTSLKQLKKYLIFGSTLMKKLVICSIKLFGLKFSSFLLSIFIKNKNK